MSNELTLFNKLPGLELSVPNDVLPKYLALAEKFGGSSRGFEDERDWSPPRLKMKQPMSNDPNMPSEAKNGEFFYAGNLVKPGVNVLMAYAWNSRVRFVQGTDNFPSCASENVDARGKGAADKSISVYGDACGKCPFNDQPGQGKKTNCANQINVILVPETLDEIFKYTFSGSGYSAGRQLTDLGRSTKSPWSRFYSLSSETKKRTAGGVYCVPTITPVSGEVVPEHLQAFSEFVCNAMTAKRAVDRVQLRTRDSDVNVTPASGGIDTLGDLGNSKTKKADYSDEL